jgi:fatty-acyl-CoA synthase
VCCSKAKVVDDDGLILPVGEKGELCIRGYGVMRGYWDDEEQTSRVIGPDRWYKTG